MAYIIIVRLINEKTEVKKGEETCQSPSRVLATSLFSWGLSDEHHMTKQAAYQQEAAFQSQAYVNVWFFLLRI